MTREGKAFKINRKGAYMEFKTRTIKGYNELISTIESMASDGWSVHNMMNVSEPSLMHSTGPIWGGACKVDSSFKIYEQYIVTFVRHDEAELNMARNITEINETLHRIEAKISKNR